MKLVVVSNTPHHLRDGSPVGWGPTVREIDHLASLVDEITHVAPVYDGLSPANALPYAASNVRVHAVRPAGGESLTAKLGILYRAPSYLRAIHDALEGADIVHVRCPANISLFALLLLAARRSPKRRWAKYAGTWPRQEHEALSYRFQRWWLTHMWPNTVVTVNGDWPNQPSHVYGLLNPCLTDAELTQARSAPPRALDGPVRLLYVGSLLDGKGVLLLPDILLALRATGVAATLEVVGDGPSRGALEVGIRERGLASFATLHGWLPRPSLPKLYRSAHFILLPSGTNRDGLWSSAEGWPKVLGEAMAYGVVPIASPVSSVPQYLRRFASGSIVDSNLPAAYVDAVNGYLRDPSRWLAESRQGMQAAPLFTYSTYIETIGNLLTLAS